jgi:hypothetical protein
VIRPLRRRHAWLAPACLALLAPAGLFLGVLARRPMPTAAKLPRELASEPAAPPGAGRTGTLEAGGVRVALRAWDAEGGRVLELLPEEDVQEPDVLVYWTPGDPGADGPPPADARLVGSLAGAHARRCALPAGSGGSVVLYSLGHRERLGAARVP